MYVAFFSACGAICMDMHVVWTGEKTHATLVSQYLERYVENGSLLDLLCSEWMDTGSSWHRFYQYRIDTGFERIGMDPYANARVSKHQYNFSKVSWQP